MATGNPLSAARRALGLTQVELAGRVNALKHRRPGGSRLRLSQSFLSALESDDPAIHKRPSIDMAKALAAALDDVLSPADLLFYETPPRTKRAKTRSAA